MADARRPELTLLLRKQGNSAVKFEFFRAEEWSGLAENQGRWRIRRNGKWIRTRTRYVFFDLLSALRLICRAMGGLADAPEPDLPRGTVVTTGQYVARTATHPIQGVDGRWYVAILDAGRGGLVHVPVDTLEVRS